MEEEKRQNDSIHEGMMDDLSQQDDLGSQLQWNYTHYYLIGTDHKEIKRAKENIFKQNMKAKIYFQEAADDNQLMESKHPSSGYYFIFVNHKLEKLETKPCQSLINKCRNLLKKNGIPYVKVIRHPNFDGELKLTKD